MFYIVLNILASVILLGIFKLFDKFKVNSFHAIIFNYFAAASTGLLFSQHNFDFTVLLHSQWIFVSIPLGFLLISAFYLISQTTQKLSMSTASVANKMSVAMPVLFSILVLHEALTVMKIIGLLLAFVALYFTTYRKSHTSKSDKHLFYLPILVFIGSGLLDLALNATKAFYIHSEQDSEMFTISSFGCAFIIGAFILMGKKIISLVKPNQNTFHLELKSIIGGFILGIPNYFSIFFIIKALESNALNSSQLFPVLNISNVVLSTLIGFVFFKEKLSVKNYTGIAIAIIAIVLITL